MGFVGEALQPQNFAENPNAPVNISLPIGRSGGDTGNILVITKSSLVVARNMLYHFPSGVLCS